MKKMIPVLVLFLLFITGLILPLRAQEDSLIEVKRLKDLMENTATPVDESGQKENEALKEEPQQEKKPEETPSGSQKEVLQESLDQKEVPVRVFSPAKENPVYSSGDFMLEKKQNYYSLWIKAKKNQSAALLNASGKGRYFLRSPGLISEQQENSVAYGKKNIGNESGLFFLASSAVKTHAVLGQAFEILIPERIVYGYGNRKTGQTLIPVPGQTQFRVRIYAEKNARGNYRETLYRLHPVPGSLTAGQNLKIIQVQNFEKQKVLTAVFFNESQSLKQISKKTGGHEEILYTPEGGSAEGFKTLFLSYHHQGPLFFMIFQVTVPENQEGALILNDGRADWSAGY